MALAIETANISTATTGTTASTTLTWAHTSTAADLLTVAVQIASDYEITSITYNGVSLSKADAQMATGGQCRAELWYLVAAALGTHDIIVRAGNPVYMTASAIGWTGVDQSVPLGTAVKATGTTTPITVAAASAAGEYVVDSAVTLHSAAITATVGAGQTEAENLSITIGTSVHRAASSYEDGAASVTMSWTLSATAAYGWATVAVPIKPATAPGATETTVSECWIIPARTEPFALADGYTGLLAQVLATRYPHLLAWKVDNGQFIWHDLGPVPAQAPLDAMAVGNVMVGGGTEPGLVLFGVESYDGIVTTNIGQGSLPVAQRRYPQAGGVADTKSGVIFLSRRQFIQPQRLIAVRLWGENVQQADTIRFGWRWDRKRWQTIGELHGLPQGPLAITDDTCGLFLECAIGITDYQPWESAVPIITRVDVQHEASSDPITPEPDEIIPGLD